MIEERPLKILNASAGSGKTYHLVQEYLQLLIGNDQNLHGFSHIIAMTFTNKAAIEMKERILSALDQIGSPHLYGEKAQHLINDLSKLVNEKPETITRRAKQVLNFILHEFEEFHVMTIDKFNLRLIKSFGRDLDLPGDFEVVLDESELIEQIVDDLMNQLGQPDRSDLNDLIIRYARTNLDQGLTWNFRRDLIQFGNVLNSEKNNAAIERLLQTDLSKEQFGRLLNHQKELNTHFTNSTQQLATVYSQYSHLSLPGKSRTSNAIQKIISSEKIPISSELIGKSLRKSMETIPKSGDPFPEALSQAILTVEQCWEQHVKEYISIDLFLKNYFNMALLQYMAERLSEIKSEENKIRISEFNTLISELIQREYQHENASFIYERLGSRFHHFLLDEFQDTSRLQWLNLVPLIHESIGQNHRNLIVGDPKQSIYRFKNGVAEQFVELPRIFNPEKDPRIQLHSNFFEQMGTVIPLENNWRSSSTIVNFNNTFFQAFKNLLPENAQAFYDSVEQSPKSNHQGVIRIESWEEKVQPEDQIPQLIEWIEECKADGFQLGDICILGGTNKVCNKWAIGLTQHHYKVVSSDSLLIQSDLNVQLTIAYLYWRLKPSGENEKKRFAELFFRINSIDFETYQIYLKELETSKGKRIRVFNDSLFLNDFFGGHHLFFCHFENIYDLIQSFYLQMKFNELESPYLHHLADISFEFGQKKGPDLKGFLEYYESNKHKIAVQIPESNDAIQVMTIHKSKGLEFPVVILPHLDFSLDIKSSFFVELEDYIVYKRPSKNDFLTPLIEVYNEEKSSILTDNINLAYVAMTRPVHRLYIQNCYTKNKFGATFHETLSHLPECIESDGKHMLTIGKNQLLENPSHQLSEETLFTPLPVHEQLWFPNISLQDSDDLQKQDYLTEQKQFGIQFHLLISRISSADEIEYEINRAIKQGEVSSENAANLSQKLNELFEVKGYSQLLEDALSHLNEQMILVGVNESIRPDKVILKQNETIVIDYKTGIPSDKDISQVMGYKSVLDQMGYPSVQCFLFYTSLNELRQVS